jgi:hypothetical protein
MKVHKAIYLSLLLYDRVIFWKELGLILRVFWSRIGGIYVNIKGR